MDTYRLDEVDDIWCRLADHAKVAVSPEDIPYQLAALRIMETRARVTAAKVSAYIAEQQGSARLDELRQVAAQLANIRHTARAAHDALALRRSA